MFEKNHDIVVLRYKTTVRGDRFADRMGKQLFARFQDPHSYVQFEEVAKRSTIWLVDHVSIIVRCVESSMRRCTSQR